MGTKKAIARNTVTIRGQTLRTLSRLFLMLLIFTHLITWYLMGIQIVGSIGIEALFSGLSRGVLNAGFFFWILVFISALLFGRAFCGWFCWFGGYLELIEVGMEKTRKSKVPRRVLLHLSTLAFVALVMKIYSSLLVTWLKNFPTMFTLQLADTEPWGGQQTGISILLTAVLYGPVLIFIFGRRAWCRYLCPIGALLKIFGSGCMGKVRLVSNECVGCGQCNHNCPMQVDVLGDIKKHGEIRSLDCIRCLKCTDICPNKTITFTLGHKKVSLSTDASKKAEQVTLKRRKRSIFDVTIITLWISASLFFTLSGLNMQAPQEIKVIMSVGLLIGIYCLVLLISKAWNRNREIEQVIY
ncbi:MAG: 4Fe-4S binding protein [Candidatus Hodarchaeales archaeon]